MWLLCSALHCGCGLLSAVLQGGDQLLDFLGGFLRPLRQTAHFIGDDREAASRFAGPRGLDGGIERQQVGLFGDRLDHIHYAADAVAFRFQAGHRFGRAKHFPGESLDLFDRLADDRIARARIAVCRIGCLRCLLGVACHFLHGSGHLLHGRCNLVGFGALAVHPDTGLLCDCRQLLGGAGHLRDAVADAADQLAQGCRHAHYPALQGTDLILTADVPLVGQVASGDISDHGKRFGEGMRDLAGNQPGRQ